MDAVLVDCGSGLQNAKRIEQANFESTFGEATRNRGSIDTRPGDCDFYCHSAS
jgi:hypothetical protein